MRRTTLNSLKLHSYRLITRFLNLRPMMLRYQEPMKPRYQEPMKLRYQEPMKPRYQEPMKLRYQEPMKLRYLRSTLLLLKKLLSVRSTRCICVAAFSLPTVAVRMPSPTPWSVPSSFVTDG